MKKLARSIYFLVMAVLIFSMSGCGSSSNNSTSSQTTAADKLMVISSPILKSGDTYKLYRGDQVGLYPISENYNPTYYAAPIDAGETVSINLEFADALGSADVPFLIEDEAGNVVFFYNPNGDGTKDTTTAYGTVQRLGGVSQQLGYNGLTISAASVKASALVLEEGETETVIELNDDGTATMDGSAVSVYNYVWHADPDHADEYYTLGDSTTELTEAEMKAEITEDVYINRDVVYMPDTLEFTGTATKDEETEYVAYYSDEVVASLGESYPGPYIFATLPQSAGQGAPGGGEAPNGGEGGTPPDGGGNPPSGRPTETPIVTAAVSNSDIAAFETMTHSAEEAYANPVLHINKAGNYRLRGTWHGQIWIDPGEDERVTLILDGVDIVCDVAPAVVFHDVYECGPDDSDTLAANNYWRTAGTEVVAEDAGAVVIIAEGSTNNVTGANVYRMLTTDKKSSATTIDGTDIDQQKKRYKMDGAFYSFVSMVMGTDNEDNPGTLNITSTTYEGLNTEMHLTQESGIVNIVAEEDGINVNEDDTSVFTLDGGTLTIVAKGGDGIDSNGWVVLNDGTLDISCETDSNQLNAGGNGPIDADQDVYMSDSVTYTHQQYSGNSSNGGSSPDSDSSGGENSSGDDNTSSGGENSTTVTREAISVTNTAGVEVMSIKYSGRVVDTDTSARTVAASGSVFTLERTVNDFAGVAYTSSR